MEGDGNQDGDSKKKTDVLFVHSPTPNGDGYHVIRAREDRVEIGQMSGLKDGEAICGEIVNLKPRKESPRLFDVDVVAPAETSPSLPTGSRSGPPQVASEAYRENWEAVFRPPRKRELLN